MTSKVEKGIRILLVLALVLGSAAAPAVGQQDPAKQHQQAVDLAKVNSSLWKPLAAVGAGLVTIGGGLGIGRLAASALDGTARQPEAGGAIRTTMIIAAALIEGFTFFALIVCIIAAG